MQPTPASQLEALEAAVASYEMDLAMDDQAQEYLAGRGLSEETVASARLGVVADPRPGHEGYRGMICIPYIVQGKVVMVRFRNLSGSGPKYLQPKGSISRIYGVDQIHAAGDTICITEGEFDSLILRQCGLHAIAIPGANAFRPHHPRMLYGFSRIWVFGDPDAAGAEFNNTIINRLPRSAKGVNMRGSGDVTDTYVASGGDAESILSAIKKEDKKS